MEYQYYTTDVFTNQLFNGAHIAVFPQAKGLNDNLMQQIARELNLSETVFIFPQDSESNNSRKKPTASRRLRIFSPHQEIDFAGHPIIAAGHVLATTGEITATDQDTDLCLHQNIGAINTHVRLEKNNESFVQFSLDNISAKIDLFTPGMSELADVLGLKENAFKLKYFTPKIITTEQSYLIIPAHNLDAIQNAMFDYSAWSRSSAPATNVRQILLFTNKTFSAQGNFHLRLMGPNIGQDVDPPVGSSIPAFVAYLNSFKNTQSGTHTFTVERGRKETRQSILQVEAILKEKTALKIRVGGSAISVSEAKIQVPI